MDVKEAAIKEDHEPPCNLKPVYFVHHTFIIVSSKGPNVSAYIENSMIDIKVTAATRFIQVNDKLQ